MIILKVILFILVYLILFLLFLAFVLLVSPIKGQGRFTMKSTYFKGTFLFGLIRIYYIESELKLKLFGFKVNTKTSKGTDDDDNKENHDDTEKKKEKTKKSFGRPTKEVLVLTLGLTKKLIKKIAPKQARLKLTLGLDDPYYTEMIHILSYLFFLPLNSIKHYDFSFQPINNDIAIDYEGEALINFSIISLILPTLRYLIRKPIRQYFKLTLKKKPQN